MAVPAVAAERLDLVLLALTLAGVAGLALHLVVAYDIWWQIGAGRWIAAHGFPEIDPFSYSATGRLWVELRWLWCLAVAGLHDSFGPSALIVASTAVALATAFALARVARAAPPWIAALAVAIAGSLALFRLDLRPEIVTFLCLQLLLLWLARLQAGERTTPWWTLGLLQVVWTNSHTLFVLGPVTLALFWGAEEGAARIAARAARAAPAPGRGAVLPPERRRWILWAALLAGLACFVNPYGWRVVSYAWTLWQQLSSASVVGRSIGELRSPFADFGWSFAALRFPVAAAVSAGALWANRRRMSAGWFALWLAYLVLAFRAERNLALFGWVAGTTTALALAAGWRDRPAKRGTPPRLLPRVAAVALVLFALGLLVSNAWYRRIDPDRRFGLGVAPGRFPDRPLAFLDRAGLDGRRLANLSDSGYVLFASGEQSVYIDGRLEVYGPEFLEKALALYDKGADFDAVARQLGIEVVVVQFGKDGGLFRTLLRRPDWAPVYFDPDRVAFARAGAHAERWRVDWAKLGESVRTPLPGEAARGAADERLTLSPERLLGAGRLAVLVGDLERARAFYRLALTGGQRGGGIALELSGLDRILGDLPEAAAPGGVSAAEAILGYAAVDGVEAALAGVEHLARRGDFSELRLYAQLPSWASRAGRLEDGERIARLWTDHEPQSPHPWKLLAALALARQRPEEALPHLRRTLELDPGQLDAWIALAEAAHAVGDESAATDALAKALAIAPGDATARRLREEWATPGLR